MNISKWMHAGTMVKMNAINYPDKLGWQDKTQEFTFKEWNDRSCRFANGLHDHWRGASGCLCRYRI